MRVKWSRVSEGKDVRRCESVSPAIFDLSHVCKHFDATHLYVRAHINSSASLCNSLRRGCLSMPVNACI